MDMTQSNRVLDTQPQGLRRVIMVSSALYGWLAVGIAIYAYQRQLWYLMPVAFILPVIQTTVVEYLHG